MTVADTPLACEPAFDLTPPDVMGAVLVGAVLGDRTRASILRVLRGGPHCVCELAAMLGVRDANVSSQLAKLREAGFVHARRHASNPRYLYYERDEAGCAAALARVREVMVPAAAAGMGERIMRHATRP